MKKKLTTPILFLRRKYQLLQTIVLLFIIMLFINNQEAQAYINPGSGSYIFQTVIGGILSVLYLFKKLLKSCVNLFRKKPGDKKDNE